MKLILMGYRTPWSVEFWAHNWHLGIFVCLRNRSAIANHASVTPLTSQNNPCASSLSTTTTTSMITMPPWHLTATTEICPQPLATTMAGPNTVDNNVSAPMRWMQRCSMDVLHHPTATSLTATRQQEWQTRNVRRFCCSLVSPPSFFYDFSPESPVPCCQMMNMVAHHPPQQLMSTHHQDLAMTMMTPHLPQPTTPSKVLHDGHGHNDKHDHDNGHGHDGHEFGWDYIAYDSVSIA